MLKEQMSKIKDMFKKDDGNNKRKIENLVVFIIILIITIIVINMILKDNKKEDTQFNSVGKTLAQTETETYSQVESNNQDELEKKLENILSKIDGVGRVNVLITYSQTSETVAMYNEDSTVSDTEEKDSGGGNRKVSETSTKKEVIYQEVNGEKVPVTQTVLNPKIEGAIITATGAQNSEIKLKITQAVEAATGLATHKIQVFEMSS